MSVNQQCSDTHCDQVTDLKYFRPSNESKYTLKNLFKQFTDLEYLKQMLVWSDKVKGSRASFLADLPALCDLANYET